VWFYKFFTNYYKLLQFFTKFYKFLQIVINFLQIFKKFTIFYKCFTNFYKFVYNFSTNLQNVWNFIQCVWFYKFFYTFLQFFFFTNLQTLWNFIQCVWFYKLKFFTRKPTTVDAFRKNFEKRLTAFPMEQLDFHAKDFQWESIFDDFPKIRREKFTFHRNLTRMTGTYYINKQHDAIQCFYDVFYSHFSQQHVSAAFSAIFRVLLSQEYEGTKMASCVVVI